MRLDNLGIMESLLFTVGDEGLEARQFADVLKMDLGELDQLISTYHSKGLEIQRYGSICTLASKEECISFIETLMKRKANTKLSRAAIETLSIITYNQPLTRSDIEITRGINPDGAVRTLIVRRLIETEDMKNSRSHLLMITDLFLNIFGMKSIEGLPSTKEDSEEIENFFSTLIDQKKK